MVVESGTDPPPDTLFGDENCSMSATVASWESFGKTRAAPNIKQVDFTVHGLWPWEGSTS